MAVAKKRVEEVSSISIPENIPVRRKVRANLAEGNPANLPGYDYKTLVYDVYQYGDAIQISGPPLINLTDMVKTAFVDERAIDPLIGEIKRTQRTTIPGTGHLFSIRSGHVRSTVSIRQADLETFAGRNVAFVISKNNDLLWIRDWCQFYNRTHGVDGVLIYDNGSHHYTPDDILETVSSIEGIEAAVVVPWPFPFGPQSKGIGAFGNFAQAGMFEHARWRFLSRANTAINVDMDELVMTGDGRSIVDHVHASEAGGVLFEGRWIEAIRTGFSGSVPRFADFSFYDTQAPASAHKWAVCPEKIPSECQWRTHWIQDCDLPVDSGVTHRHFKGISASSRWRQSRTDHVPYDPGIHVVDDDLVRALKCL